MTFASYGTPQGTCNAFALGSCHDAMTKTIVEDLCLGESSCSLSATSGVFSEPCPVIEKNLRVQVECSAGPSFNEDTYFNAWSSRHWTEAEPEIESRTEEWRAHLSALPEYPVGRFSGRGVIVVAGGRYLEPALVMIKMLRQSGCNLRVQVWHLGKEEMTESNRALLEPWNVETRDFRDFVGDESLKAIPANVGMRLFQLKPLAMLHSDLEDVLLLDSDNCPVRDPTYLFDSPEFSDVGTIFWPDYWKTSTENPIWKIVGRNAEDGWEQESGQLMIHKAAAWKAINLAVHLNSEFYMKLLNGDKDTFRFSWHAAGVDFKMIDTWPTPVGTLKELYSSDTGFCGHTMLQHDFEGRPLFVHHNQLKHAVLPKGENFKYQKLPGNITNYKAAPVSGLHLESGVVLACIDVMGTNDPRIDGTEGLVSESDLDDFEDQYIAAMASIPKNAFTSDQLMRKSLLGGSRDESAAATPLSHRTSALESLVARLRRESNTTCTPVEFEVEKPTFNTDRTCELISECSADQIQYAAPTAVSDRICTSTTEASLSSNKLIVRAVRSTETQEGNAVSIGGAKFLIKDTRRSTDTFIPSPTLQLTRLESYEFVMDDVPLSDPFILTLDDIGGPDATVLSAGVLGNGAIGSQILTFTPGPDTPATIYYQSKSTEGMGGRLNVAAPTFKTAFESGRRFSTAFSIKARIFEHSEARTVSSTVQAIAELCQMDCAVVPACKGVFAYATAQKMSCFGLTDVGGDGTKSSVESVNMLKVVF